MCQAHRGAHLLSNLKPKAYSSCGRKALVGALIVSVLVNLESSLKAHIKSYRCCFYSFYDKTRITNEANKSKYDSTSRKSDTNKELVRDLSF